MSCFNVEVQSFDASAQKWRQLYHNECLAHFASSSYISLKDQSQNTICSIILPNRFRYLKVTSRQYLIFCSTKKYRFELNNDAEACMFENALLQLVNDSHRKRLSPIDKDTGKPIVPSRTLKKYPTKLNIDKNECAGFPTTVQMMHNICCNDYELELKCFLEQRPRLFSIRQKSPKIGRKINYCNSQQKMQEGMKRITQTQRLFKGKQMHQEDLVEVLIKTKGRNFKGKDRAERLLNQKICPCCRSVDELCNCEHCFQEIRSLTLARQSKNLDGILPHEHLFKCTLCEHYTKGLFVIKCMHNFCRNCLALYLNQVDTYVVHCPLCEVIMPTTEICKILCYADYSNFLKRTLASAEENGLDVFCCRTNGCNGWTECSINTDMFNCPLCARMNCLKCQESHKTQSCDRLQAFIRNFPVSWFVNNEYNYLIIVRLNCDSDEYLDIAAFMRKQLTADCVIKKIERCQNSNLWQKYEKERSMIIDENGDDVSKERALFHGSTQTDPFHILREGDWPSGSFFAENSKYSLAHAYHLFGNTYQLISAKVLTGSTAVSQVDEVSTIYTIDNPCVAYPNYLITFDTVL